MTARSRCSSTTAPPLTSQSRETLLDKQVIAKPKRGYIGLSHQMHSDAPAGQYCEAVKCADAFDRLAIP
jgi:hypothetical protein